MSIREREFLEEGKAYKAYVEGIIERILSDEGCRLAVSLHLILLS